MVSLKQYYKMLVKHDWYYRNSDDMLVYNQGTMYEVELAKIAEKGGQPYKDLLAAFLNHFFSGPAFSNEVAPLPKLAD